MLVKPLVNNDCCAYRLIIILGDSTPTKEETHHEAEFIREEFPKCFFSSVCYLKSVRSQQLLGCSSGGVGDLADVGAGGHEDRGAGHDLLGHQTRGHWAQVGVKGRGCCCCCAGIGSQAWRHREHGLDESKMKAEG